MTALDHYRDRALAQTQERRPRWLSNAVGRVNGSADLSLAKIEAAAEVQAVKTDAVTYVAGRAMHSATILSTLETQLAQTCPQSSGRLALIADLTSLSLADLVQQTALRVRSL